MAEGEGGSELSEAAPWRRETPAADLLKPNRGAIMQAPLPRGPPRRDDAVHLPLAELDRRSAVKRPRYRAIRKLL